MRELNPEVFVAEDPVPVIGKNEIEFLKVHAKTTPRHRARLCGHKSPQDRLHDMLIVLTGRVYIRPHRHMDKAESFHIIEGSVDVVFFDESGMVADVIAMGDAASGKPFFYRIDRPLFHSLVVRSETLVFHEATQGPFVRENSEQAAWAPAEEDRDGIERYRKELENKIKEFQK